jgi:hypothetical protein
MFMASPATKPDQLVSLRTAWGRIVAAPAFQATLVAEDRAVKDTDGPDLERLLSSFFGAGSSFTGLVQKTLECGQRISGGDLKPCP